MLILIWSNTKLNGNLQIREACLQVKSAYYPLFRGDFTIYRSLKAKVWVSVLKIWCVQSENFMMYIMITWSQVWGRHRETKWLTVIEKQKIMCIRTTDSFCWHEAGSMAGSPPLGCRMCWSSGQDWPHFQTHVLRAEILLLPPLWFPLILFSVPEKSRDRND